MPNDRPRTAKHVAGGILAIIAAALALIGGLICVAGGAVLAGEYTGTELVIGLGVVSLVLGAVALAGGICAMLASLSTFGLLGIPGFVLGLLALIFVAISKAEFA
jgi:general stress protein CsbA